MLSFFFPFLRFCMYVNSHGNPSSLTYFIQHGNLWVHPCRCKWQGFTVLMAESRSIVRTNRNFLVQPSADGHLGGSLSWPL